MKFCVIGLGRFGQQVVKTLHENGAEVLAVDTLESNIISIKNYTAQAICVTVHDEPTLEAIGVDEMDVIIIAIGENFSESILIAAILKKRSTKYKVIARATGQVQKEIFKLIGVDQVISPEEETAIELADTLSYPFTNLARLDANFSVGLIATPTKFIGKTIAETQLYDRYGISCFAVKKNDAYQSVDQSYVIAKNDLLAVSGKSKTISELLHL
ncbi:MAG: TrkA family potassium uptake protein [Candidatus Chromulinivorax sp.]|nr:TrkA family potassium uptake protein [Candidatus Chromulinivorax sp.]